MIKLIEERYEEKKAEKKSGTKKAKDGRKDLLDYYVEVLDSGEYTLDELYEDFETLIIAGFDTTSSTIAAAYFYMKKYPETEKKLIDEIHKVLGSNVKAERLHKVINMEKLKEFNYLNYFVKEVMRHNNASENTGLYTAKQKVEIAGVEFAKGSIFMHGLSGLHMNPNEWKNPLEFIPERFDPES
jgi:cytochrome P450